MRRREKMRKGFTLVELLMVVVVLAILAGAVLTAYKNFTHSAKADDILEAYRKISQASRMMVQDTTYYPKAIQELWKNINGVPDWKGPYLEPPAGNVSQTVYPVLNTLITASVSCVQGGAGKGKFDVVVTGNGLTPKIAKEVVKQLGSTVAYYDSAKNKLILHVTTAEAQPDQYIYCK